MKIIIQYFKKRYERKLRERCVKYATSANIAHFCTCQNSHVQKMYFCSMKKASINRKPLFMIGNADSNIV